MGMGMGRMSICVRCVSSGFFDGGLYGVAMPLPLPLYCVVLRFGGLFLEGWCGAGTSDLVS